MQHDQFDPVGTRAGSGSGARRGFILGALGAATLLGAGVPFQSVAGLGDLKVSEMSGGMKQALEKGSEIAISQLSKPGGYLDGKWRIPLPRILEDGKSILKALGRSKDLEQLQTGINRAAEAAVPEAKALIKSAINGMSITDAKNILTGGDDSVTKFFASKTRDQLITKFLPIVKKTTDKMGLAQQYNSLASKAGGLGLVKKEESNIENFVTGKALDGLYGAIGEQEKQFRADPVGKGGGLIGKVFGALKK